MPSIRTRWLVVTVGLVLVTPIAAQAQNLVDEPGFEDGGRAWSLLDYASSIVGSPTHGGSGALKLVNDFDGDSSAKNHNVWQKEIPGVEGGQEYEFTVWVSGQDVEGIGAGGKPLAVLQWVSATGEKLRREMYMWAPYGTYDFQSMSIRSEAPLDAVEAHVGFRSWWDCTGGSTTWDDISLSARALSWSDMVELGSYQAEDASSRSSATVSDEREGFLGTGYLELNANGAHIEWTDVSSEAGERTLVLRYAMEAGNTEIDLSVNGSSEGILTLQPTGSPDSWATIGEVVHLANGDNEVRVDVVGRYRLTFIDALLVFVEDDPVETDGDADSDSDGDVDGDADSDGDGDADGDADGDIDGDGDGDSDGDGDGDADGDGDGDADSDGDGDDIWGEDVPEQGGCTCQVARAGRGGAQLVSLGLW